MTDCIFCKIVNKEIPAEVIYENDMFIAIADNSPVHYGHSLLIPKEHYEDIYSLPEEILSGLGKELQRLSCAVKKAVDADGINIHVNNGSAAGQVIFHSHIHIIPRYEKDNLKHWPSQTDNNKDRIKESARKVQEAVDN